MRKSLLKKLATLSEILKNMGKVLIAYSGGADSTLLLKVAKDNLGRNVLAVTAESLTYPQEEIEEAKKTAKKIGARHIIIKSRELNNKKFIRNSKDRCYWCKKELFLDLLKIAKRKKIPYIVEASNLDDLKDFRPGLRAVKEAGVRSPLIEAGFTKKNIREASKKLGLPTYNKPPFACLASRIPYGEEITKERLLRIEKAERFLKNLGLFQVRVRDHKEICRIEVGESDFSKVLKNRRKITNFLQKLGYIFVSLDLRGYKPGSMNRLLR